MARRIIAVVLVFTIVICVCCMTVDFLSERKASAELEMISNAVRGAAVTCYAVEGAYPSDIDYLKQNYGLQYDEERYTVVYNAFAGNILPDINVLERGR